jgi:hypothetical protein
MGVYCVVYGLVRKCLTLCSLQLTGALRSLSDAASVREGFVASSIIPQLASVLSDHIASADIVFNISRVLR